MVDENGSEQVRSPAVLAISLYLGSLIFLQKVGLPVPGRTIDLCFFSSFVLVAALLVQGCATVDRTRAVLFLLFCGVALLAQLISENGLSNALTIAIAIHLPWLFVAELTRADWRLVLWRFQQMMMVIALVVIAQQALQFFFGAQSWPNLDQILPDTIRVKQFNYLRETGYGTGRFLPNGIVFLEPSVASQFLALAFLASILLYRSFVVASTLFVGLLAVQAGSGLLVLALATPLVAARLPMRVVIPVLLGLGAVTALAVYSGALDVLLQRMGELSQPTSSGYARYVGPVKAMLVHLREPSSLYYGVGAGNEQMNELAMSLFVSKLIIEYGVATLIAFVVFVLYVCFSAAPSREIAFAVLLVYTLGGAGFAVPVFSSALFVLAGLMRVTDAEGTRHWAGK